mmetsp:Transcript_42874/g.142707  ORF Transcript_42874/g.142707 Transcript_42874/m.142707 type:complete len:317 (+) Transcript_42874:640-1590(+)
MTGLGSRTAASKSPFASCGVDGITTLRPGTAVNHASRDCECCADRRCPPPCGPRITMGMLTLRPSASRCASPPSIRRHLAAWLTTLSIISVTMSNDLHLHNRHYQAGRRRAHGTPADARLADGRLDDAPRPKLARQAGSALKDAPHLADVLPHHDDARVRAQRDRMRLGDRLGEAALARPARRLRGRGGGGGGGVPRRRKARRRKDGRIQVSEARLRARACERLGGVHRGSSARGEDVDGAQRAFLAAEAGEAAAQHEERVLAPDLAVVIGEGALGQVLADVVRAVPKGERLYDARPLARARLADAVGGRFADGDL